MGGSQRVSPVKLSSALNNAKQIKGNRNKPFIITPFECDYDTIPLRIKMHDEPFAS